MQQPTLNLTWFTLDRPYWVGDLLTEGSLFGLPFFVYAEPAYAFT